MSELTSRNWYALCARGGVALVAVVVAAACTGGSVHSAPSSPSPPNPSTNPASPSTAPSVTVLPPPRPHIVSKLTCAHFVIDTDGTIYQLVLLGLMCRHTVGLNYTAIGIEMVGQSDQDMLGNPPQLAAALDLTLWLMRRFHIQLGNVIGHNESLTSPLHRELVASYRCQTHQDWNPRRHGDLPA
ncbi:MAG TPA: peptidoglycan recognition family protein [Actinomycetota bacterium]|nr:peptidoglycan recognition family protein [Actinomycetota bacterium]